MSAVRIGFARLLTNRESKMFLIGGLLDQSELGGGERGGCTGLPHCRSGVEERKGRLGAAVHVDPMGMQTVEAGAGFGIVHRLANVVIAEEPPVSRVGSDSPSPVAAETSCVKVRR